MAEETHMAEAAREPRKRKIGKKKGSKAKKKAKMLQSAESIRAMKPKKIDKKMQKLYRKRARDYNSEDESEQDNATPLGNNEDELIGGSSSGEEAEKGGDHSERNVDNGFSDDEEHGEILPGIMRFTEGSNAFRLAFRSIIKKTVPEDVLGPVLSGQKKLVAEKLAEEENERKVKGEAKKEKQLVIEKGHVKPANYLDSHEKFLIGVATKGVVKLFNAVNKAQNAQKGLNPSKFKDAKVIKKRRKEAFFSELGKTSSRGASASAKAHTSKGPVDGEGPAWAPRRKKPVAQEAFKFQKPYDTMDRDYNYYSYWDYFSIPLHLCFFISILVFILGFTWYINYESMFEDLMTQVKLFLMLVPLLLLLVVHCLSGGLSFFLPFPEKDSLHRAGGSPWGVGLVLVFLLIMISYQSSFHERWFPLLSR